MKGVGGRLSREGSVCEIQDEAGRKVGGLRMLPQGGEGKKGGQETGAPGNTFGSPPRGGKVRGHGPH